MADVEEPAAKKAKVEDKEKDVADGEEEKVDVKQNDGGESYFEISRTRRVTVRKYKGKVMVDIREVSASVVRKCFGNSCLSRFHVFVLFLTNTVLRRFTYETWEKGYYSQPRSIQCPPKRGLVWTHRHRDR